MGSRSTISGAERGPEDLYEVIDTRYEKGSILLTSNRDRPEWPSVFGEPLLASAALDRLTHGADLVKIVGDSYRAKRGTKTTSQTANKPKRSR